MSFLAQACPFCGLACARLTGKECRVERNIETTGGAIGRRIARGEADEDDLERWREWSRSAERCRRNWLFQVRRAAS